MQNVSSKSWISGTVEEAYYPSFQGMVGIGPGVGERR